MKHYLIQSASKKLLIAIFTLPESNFISVFEDCERLNVTVNTYCPSIIDQITFNKAREIITNKDLLLSKKQKRTRTAKISPNSSKKKLNNIFAHLIYNDSNNEEIIPVRKKVNDTFEYRYYTISNSSMFLI